MQVALGDELLKLAKNTPMPGALMLVMHACETAMERGALFASSKCHDGRTLVGRPRPQYT